MSNNVFFIDDSSTTVTTLNIYCTKELELDSNWHSKFPSKHDGIPAEKVK